MLHFTYQRLHVFLICALMLLSGNAIAQTVVTINATGTTGSFNTGSVNSSGTKNDGNLVNISTSSGNNRGWAVFDLSSIPAGVVITGVEIEFVTYSSTNSTASNTIRGFVGNPATMAGNTLYTQIGSATTFVSAAWPANNTHTFSFNAAGETFVENNVGSKIVIGFVRGSTNSYNIYGYPGTAAQQPKLRISYLIPCSGTPSAGTIDAPTDVCPGKNFTLDLNGHTVASNITYQWQSKPVSGGAFTNIGTNSPTLTTSITVPTEFRCVVTCTKSAKTDITPVVSIAVNDFYSCYCKDNLGGNTSASIDSVHILKTTLNNGSAGTAAGSYTQYTATGNKTATLQAGGLYNLYVKYGSAAIGSVWIDANKNGTFEASEWTQINNGGNEGLAMIRIPGTAIPGLTGMRIRSADAGSANGSGNACSNSSSGETEDYVINIAPAPVNDIQVVAILNPVDGSIQCPFKDMPLDVVIYNSGSTGQTNFPVTADLTGAVQSTHVYNYTKQLKPFTFDTIRIHTYNMFFVSQYQFNVYTGLSNDVDRSNDTVILQFSTTFAPGKPVVKNDSVCFGETAYIHVKGDTIEHKWYSDPQMTNLVFTGDTMSFANLNQDRVFYVTSQKNTYKAGSLTTINSGGNSCSGGTMFDVIPNENMSLDSFAARFQSTGNQTINVYYRVGTFNGFETNQGAWTLLGTTSTNVTSTSTLTPFSVNTSLPMTKGTRYGIYINYDASYTNGSNPYSNADVTIETGTGLCSPFSGTNAGRMFNGTIYYSIGSTGCESEPQVVGAYAGPKPVVNLGPDVSVCADAKLVLDAGNAGAQYKWNTGDFYQTLDVTNRPGTYWVEVDKYCKESDTINIALDPLPEISGGISFVQNGNTYKFIPAGLKHTNGVLWIFGDGSTSSKSEPEYVYQPGHGKRITLVAFNACGTDTAYIFIPIGIAETAGEDKDVLVYPNPASTMLTIEAKAGVEMQYYTITNTQGVVVMKNNTPATSKMTIDVSALPAGNYFLRVATAEGVINKPVLITNR